MKIKNIVAGICMAISIASTVNAQEYKIQVQNSRDAKLSLVQFPGDLPIEGYSGNEIIITSDYNGKTPDRAKGLKPVYAEGTDNTGVGVYMEKNGNQITLKCLLPIFKRQQYKIRVPDNFSVKLDNECGNSGNIQISNLKNELEVKNCQGVKLINVSGPVVLSTIAGDVDVVFTELSKERPISLASISGEIDITLPAKSAVDLEMETMTGAVYSDFDFPASNQKMKQVGGGKFKTQLNGGGVGFKITNISGNIYLRKS
jgi:lia operon protein LiaG